MKWNLVPLGTVCNVSSSKRIFAKEYRTEGIPFYRGKEVIEKHKGNPVSTELFISKERYEEIRCKYDVPQIGDILLTSVGTLGVSWLVDETEFYFKDGNLTWLRAKDGLLNKFLYLWLNSDDAKHQIDMMCIGSTQKALTIETINKFVIPLPSMQEQESICAVIYPIIERIKNNRNINDNLYEMVNAYYTSLFKDVECEMTTIGNYAERIYSGGTPTTSNAAYWDGAFGWFSSGETRNRFVISTEKTITQAGIDNSSTKLAAKHDIVMASAGQGFTRGQTSMLLIDTYVNQSVIVIHADRNVLPFLFWNLANRYEKLRAISDSSSIRGSLTTKMIAAFEIPLANEESLQAFADFSWSVIPQIENNLLENERLAALRDNLLPKLMSGEIDVSNIQL